MDDANPTARALQALMVLQDYPGITAELLGRKLGVSDRAARRYVAVLRSAGVPIDSLRGRYGGYRLARGVRLPPLMFSATEALGLVMAVLDGNRPADAADAVGTALGKLLGALPEPVARQAEAVRRTAAAAPDRGAARPAPDVTARLVQACADRRRSRLDYRSEAGRQWVGDVDPWAVVVRHGRWYLLCWSHTSEARRAYRVDRVTSVAVLDDTFTPPTDLDPVADLEDHLAVGWEHDIEVVIDAPAETVAPCLPRALGQLSSLGGGTSRLVGSTSNPTWYAEQLATIPAPYRIVQCPELRQAARRVGERLLAAAEVSSRRDGPARPPTAPGPQRPRSR